MHAETPVPADVTFDKLQIGDKCYFMLNGACMAFRVCASVEGLHATDTLTVQCDAAACTFASQLPRATAAAVALPRATAAAVAGDVLVDEEDWLVEVLVTGKVQPRLSLLSRAEFDSLSNVYLLPPNAAGSLLCHT